MRTKATFALASLALLVLVTTSGAQSADVTYGEPFTIETITPLAEIIASPSAFVGKEVRTAGYVYEMCQDMGCWLGVLPSLDAAKMVKIAWIQTDVRFPIGDETTAHYVEIQGEVISAEQEAEEHEAHMVEEGEDPAAHVEEPAEHATRTIYVCATQPEVMSAAPGTCPTSGEKMVAKEVPVPEFSALAINGRSAVVKAKK